MSIKINGASIKRLQVLAGFRSTLLKSFSGEVIAEEALATEEPVEAHRLRIGLSWYVAKRALFREAVRATRTQLPFALNPTAFLLNVLAVHGHSNFSNFGGQHVDGGLLRRIPPRR